MKYKAATRIVHGMPDGTRKEFEEGSIVTGLDKDTMKRLWQAGALVRDEEFKTEDPKPVEEGFEESTVPPSEFDEKSEDVTKAKASEAEQDEATKAKAAAEATAKAVRVQK